MATENTTSKMREQRTVEITEQMAFNRTVEPACWKIVQARLLRNYVCVLGLVLSDVVAFTAAAYLFRDSTVMPRQLFLRGLSPMGETVDIFYVLAALFIVVRFDAGDYTKRQLFYDSTGQTTATLLFTSLLNVLILLLGIDRFSCTTTFGSWLFVIVIVPMFRQTTRWLLSKLSFWWLPTVLIGEGERLGAAYKFVEKTLSIGFDMRFIIGTKMPDGKAQGVKLQAAIVMRDSANIVAKFSEYGCRKAVTATDESVSPQFNDQVRRLTALDIGTIVIPSLRQLPLLGTRINFTSRPNLLLLQFRSDLLRLPSRFAKRAFDIVSSLTRLVLRVISWLIVRSDRESVCFVQRCAGRKCLDNNFKLRKDPRIGSVGNRLRRVGLDELPQLFNGLVRRIGLVEPRPLIPRGSPSSARQSNYTSSQAGHHRPVADQRAH